MGKWLKKRSMELKGLSNHYFIQGHGKVPTPKVCNTNTALNFGRFEIFSKSWRISRPPFFFVYYFLNYVILKTFTKTLIAILRMRSADGDGTPVYPTALRCLQEKRRNYISDKVLTIIGRSLLMGVITTTVSYMGKACLVLFIQRFYNPNYFLRSSFKKLPIQLVVCKNSCLRICFLLIPYFMKPSSKLFNSSI